MKIQVFCAHLTNNACSQGQWHSSCCLILTLQRGELGDACHSENEACRGKTSDDRHAARSYSLLNISTTPRASVIGLVWPY
jgi:hypothetical protein